MVNDAGASTALAFTRFKEGAKDENGAPNIGSFNARTMLERREASLAARVISEQAASYESLGIHLQCAWAEVCHGTMSESSPSLFRLAVACRIFDHVCAVVGHYSDLLLSLRKEMFSCLFKDFDEDAPLANMQDYALLLPYFLEHRRLDMERKTHAATIAQAKALAARNAARYHEDDEW